MPALRRIVTVVALGTLLTSASAHAQPWGYYGHHHHDGGRFVTGLALGALGGIAAGSVIEGRVWAPPPVYSSPYPVYVAPTVPVPVIPPSYPYGYPGAMTVVTPTPYGYVTRILPPPPVTVLPYGYPY